MHTQIIGTELKVIGFLPKVADVGSSTDGDNDFSFPLSETVSDLKSIGCTKLCYVRLLWYDFVLLSVYCIM